MTSTELIEPPVSEHPSFGEMVTELVPLVGAVAGYGPPVISLAAPWLLLTLMLAAPFAVLLTVIVAMLAAAALVVALAAAVFAIVTAPSRIMAHRRTVRAERATPLVTLGSPRVAA